MKIDQHRPAILRQREERSLIDFESRTSVFAQTQANLGVVSLQIGTVKRSIAQDRRAPGGPTLRVVSAIAYFDFNVESGLGDTSHRIKAQASEFGGRREIDSTRFERTRALCVEVRESETRSGIFNEEKFARGACDRRDRSELR